MKIGGFLTHKLVIRLRSESFHQLRALSTFSVKLFFADFLNSLSPVTSGIETLFPVRTNGSQSPNLGRTRAGGRRAPVYLSGGRCLGAKCCAWAATVLQRRSRQQ